MNVLTGDRIVRATGAFVTTPRESHKVAVLGVLVLASEVSETTSTFDLQHRMYWAGSEDRGFLHALDKFVGGSVSRADTAAAHGATVDEVIALVTALGAPKRFTERFPRYQLTDPGTRFRLTDMEDDSLDAVARQTLERFEQASRESGTEALFTRTFPREDWPDPNGVRIFADPAVSFIQEGADRSDEFLAVIRPYKANPFSPDLDAMMAPSTDYTDESRGAMALVFKGYVPVGVVVAVEIPGGARWTEVFGLHSAKSLDGALLNASRAGDGSKGPLATVWLIGQREEELHVEAPVPFAPNCATSPDLGWGQARTAAHQYFHNRFGLLVERGRFAQGIGFDEEHPLLKQPGK